MANDHVMAILERLEAGEEPSGVARSLDLAPRALIAAVGRAVLGEESSEGPELLPSKPRYPRLAAALSERSLAGLAPQASRTARLALSSGLLQIHDFWDASHEAAQQADDLGERAVSAYWHGIAHRREPDAGNASYWFRRVGRHPLFDALAQAALPLLEAEGDSDVSKRLISGGVWNPYGMIELCADGRPRVEVTSLARKLQRLEMSLLLKATAEAAGISL
jgi:hypothetical protein